MALRINLRKIILASKLEFILLCFFVENYGTLLLTSFRNNSRMINPICIFVCIFEKCA